MAQGGKQPGAGRPKGSQNKETVELKAMISGALQDVGGRTYLARQAEDNPTAFMNMLGKILPKDIKQEISGPDGKDFAIKIVFDD